MYPLNMHHKAAGGYAVANDEDEHKSLSANGYEPKWEAPVDADDAATAAAEEVVHTVETLRAALDAKEVAWKGNWGMKRLQQALDEAAE